MEDIRRSVQVVCKNVFGVDVEPQLTRPDEQFGDYSTNVALQLAGNLGTSPREIADQMARELKHESIASVEVAGPGFLNIRLTDEALWALIAQESNKSLEGQVVLVEYSDPNPFKPLHAGHLYTTLVGDSIARLIEAAGAKIQRLNYGGDVGLHVAKSMWSIIRYLGGENPEKLAEIKHTDRPTWLGERYVEGNTAFEDDEQSKQEIIDVNKRVYQLHESNDHDSPFAQIYWQCREWSYDYFAELYEQLQVHSFDRFIPESEVTPLGIKTVQEQFAGGVYEKGEGGAVIFDGEKYGLHKRVFINSEGLPTYETKDVGLSLTKWRDYHFDRSIIITASEQDQYMQVVLKSIEQFAPELAEKTSHITHGVVKLAGGVKMSSRKGNVVTALDILTAARQAGEASQNQPNEETILAAVKYAFARVRIGGDIIYDPAESVALEGNSGPYLQYAHARARSILAKSTVNHAEFSEFDAAERSLVRKIGEFAEVVDLAVSELMPHHICTYLYELAQVFNRFYEQSRVIGDKREAERIALVSKYADTLKAGLELLGISAPDTM